jgi:hypothetical protein
MGVFGRLFGTEKAIDNIIDKDAGLVAQVGAWIGNKTYTDEEMAEANAVTRVWALDQLNALAPFKVVQRILAFAVTFLWVFGGMCVIGAIFVEAYVNFGLVEGAAQLDLRAPLLKFILSDYVFLPTMLVYGLYFGGGVIESIKSKLSTTSPREVKK